MLFQRLPLALTGAALAVAVAACADAPTMSPPELMPQYKAAKVTNPAMTWTLPGAGTGLVNDGAATYVNGVCAVSAQLNVLSGTLDATIDVSAPKGRACGRTMGVRYPTGQRQVALFANLVKLGSAPEGSSEQRLILNPGLSNGSDECGRILFGEGSNGVASGSTPITVVRSGDSFAISADGVAWCEKRNMLFASSVNFTVTIN